MFQPRPLHALDFIDKVKVNKEKDDNPGNHKFYQTPSLADSRRQSWSRNRNVDKEPEEAGTTKIKLALVGS